MSAASSSSTTPLPRAIRHHNNRTHHNGGGHHHHRHNSTTTSPPCVLATVSYSGHFRVLLQFYLSYAANVLDPQACGLLALVSTDAEVTSLSTLLYSAEYAAQLGGPVLRRLTIVALPAALEALSPGTTTALPSAKNRGQWGRLYVCAKKAYAARYAHEVLNAAHAIVTDSEAYVWKPLSIRRLFEEASEKPTVWYADAPAHHKDKSAAGRLQSAASIERSLSSPARIDANWCSIHVYRDARGMSKRALLNAIPGSTSTLFEYMLFSYPREPFRAYWKAVETKWKRPWFDALVKAHEAEPRCVGVGFWLEVSWHLFLYQSYREATTQLPPTVFVNVTQRIEAALGTPFVMRDSYVHSRLELLWRAVSNSTLSGFERFYESNPLPLFRFEHRQRGHCTPLRLVANVPPPAASFQANSAVPNWVFERCKEELAMLQRWRREAGREEAPLPWVRHSTLTRR